MISFTTATDGITAMALETRLASISFPVSILAGGFVVGSEPIFSAKLRMRLRI